MMSTSRIPTNVMRKVNNLLYLQQSHCSVTSKVTKCWEWDISPLIGRQSGAKYAVLVLNRPIQQNQEFMTSFWNNAQVRVTIDGGTVKWDQYVSRLSEDLQCSVRLPDLVTGDFDSITDDVLQKYKKKGCQIVHTPDQNYTDFTKALMELNSYCKLLKLEIPYVIAVGQSSGRIDQTLANMQTLFLAKEKQLLGPNTRLFLLSDDALSWLLYPGNHIITIPADVRKQEKAWCSLVPIGEPCRSVTTTGLKWNLVDRPLKFGDVVSTSNTYSGAEKVYIKCSHTILWSMKMPGLL